VEHEGQFFRLVSIHTYARTIDLIRPADYVGTSVFCGSVTPRSKGAGSRRSQILVTLRTPISFNRERPIGTVTHLGEGRINRGQLDKAMLPMQGDGAPGSQF